MEGLKEMEWELILRACGFTILAYTTVISVLIFFEFCGYFFIMLASIVWVVCLELALCVLFSCYDGCIYVRIFDFWVALYGEAWLHGMVFMDIIWACV